MNPLNTLKSTYHQRKKVFHALCTGLVLSFVCYSFAIASTTLSISESKDHNTQIQDLQTEIAELELAYFDMINTLSLEGAYEYGFDETPEVHFAHIEKNTSVAYNF